MRRTYCQNSVAPHYCQPCSGSALAVNGNSLVFNNLTVASAWQGPITATVGSIGGPFFGSNRSEETW
jgi:hypothetical protein